ncbi:UNVERIFIED_CONTAM: hypothetical protein FKN15_004738 [Acipenser sinensis]
MSAEKSVRGERAQEAELQAEIKKTLVSQITHFPEDTREVPSSERTLDATPIIPNPQDQDKPQGPADTSPVTSTGQGIQRMPVSRFLCTKLPPGEIKIGSVGSDTASLSWGSPDNLDGIPHSFKITYSSSDRSHLDSITASSNSTVISNLRPGTEYSLTVNTVLENGTQSMPASATVCTNSFLQQEMMSKMSMCQFAVPLLLPDCSTNQCTLMLWAMRDVVKKFRPHSLADSKGFVEDSIVNTAMPMISFVRLGDCSLSKSQILNQVLSNPQQYYDVFIHRNMECGNVPRRIANGLVDISWYLPCGKNNLDIFPEPVAVANLHGDLLSFQKQFSILCQTSSAVFIFFDSIAESECNLLSSAGNIKAQLFLVANFPNKTEKNLNSLKGLGSKLQLSGSHFLFKKQQTNDAEFVMKLRSTMNDIMENCQHKMTIEGMSIEAHEFGIPVDEDCTECQNAKRSAAEITCRIDDVVQYKEDQLPLQGKLWKELAKIEKEECRLRKAGDQPIEEYKANLQREKQKLRQQQSSYDLSEAMQCFIAAISTESKEERSYFLKWMRMNLDVTARKKLSGLRDKYKEKSCKLSENKEIIAALDQQILNSSLGIEHFMREMGQIYEAACCHPDYKKYCKQFQHLPSLGADLLLDGFPLELVDGDASNIPVSWVTDVLTKLHEKVQQKSRVLVVTVLGVQSTGKSTLLNTMFGVQFAVSSGRCTRGAFMLLIRVKEDLKEELNCDFILVIDTEGLKSPALAQLEDSYEHDNELATLVVDFSSSLKTEASAEMDKQEKQIQDKLANYYKKKNGNVHLVEKHREDFVNSIKSLRREIENSVKNKCETNIAIHKEMKKINAIREEYRATIERKVLCLLDECKKRKSPLSEEQLEKEFETMWKQTVSELKFQGLKTRDIVSDILNKLRINLGRQGSQVQKELSEVKDLTDCEQTCFIATEKHFDSLDNQKINEKPGLWSMCKNTWKMLSGKPKKKELENKATEMANKIIQTCQQFVSQQTSGKADYHDTYTRELLQMIDKELDNEETLKTNAQFELDLKLHICGYTATAEEFTERCLKPAVREYINKALGIDIVDEMLTGAQSVKYSSRSFFQFSILKKLLDEDNFGIYVEYIKNYETFVKGWISDQIVQYFTTDAKIGDLETKLLETITKKIQAAIENAQKETAESQSTTRFIQMICRNLNKDLVISREELGAVLFLKNSNHKEFAKYLQVLVNELTGTLRAEFSKGCDVEKKLINLSFKPQDELFKRMFGCGKLCPFCKVPCEAGGQDHKEHHTSVHRPQGLGRYRYVTNEKLTENVCTSDVFSERKFRNSDTEWEPHPYKDYRRFYPDWNIPPDPSIEASDYWKYVLTKFNEEFAEEYHAKPADIPAEWKTITKDMAMKSLSKLFNVKT